MGSMRDKADSRLRMMLLSIALLLGLQWCMPVALFGASASDASHARSAGLPVIEVCEGLAESDEGSSTLLCHAMPPAMAPSHAPVACPQELNADRECRQVLRVSGLQPAAP